MINKLLTDLINSWTENEKCGRCWVFKKTFNDHIKGLTNLYQASKDDKCCTHIFLEGMTIKVNKSVSQLTGGTTTNYCDYILHLRVAEQSDFQKPKGDEINCNESIYTKHVAPLIDCISCSFEDDVCGLLEFGTVAIFNEETKPFFSFGDSNWAGLDYRLTIREYKN